MYKRIFDIEGKLDEGMFLVGARQTGKSTLLREHFKEAIETVPKEVKKEFGLSASAKATYDLVLIEVELAVVVDAPFDVLVSSAARVYRVSAGEVVVAVRGVARLCNVVGLVEKHDQIVPGHVGVEAVGIVLLVLFVICPVGGAGDV